MYIGPYQLSNNLIVAPMAGGIDIFLFIINIKYLVVFGWCKVQIGCNHPIN